MPIQITLEGDPSQSGGPKYLAVKGMKNLKSGSRFTMLDHPAFPKLHSFNANQVNFNWRDKTALPHFLGENTDSGKVDSHYIPQLLAGLAHAHERMLVLGEVGSRNVVTFGNYALIMELSTSAMYGGNNIHYEHPAIDWNAPETHLYKNVGPKSDVYGLGLWWVCAQNRIFSFEQPDFNAIHRLANDKATLYQRMLLEYEPCNRITAQRALHMHLQNNTLQLSDQRRKEFGTAVQKVFGAHDATFDELIKYAVPETVKDLKPLLTSFFNLISQHCEHRRGKFFNKVSAKAEALMKLFAAMREHNAEYLSKIDAAELYHAGNLLLVFFQIDSEAGVKLIQDFVEAKLYDITDDFLVEIHRSYTYVSELGIISQLCKPSPLSLVLRTMASDSRADLQDVIDRLKEQATEASTEMEKLRAEVERLKAENAEFNKSHEELQRVHTDYEMLKTKFNAVKQALEL